MLSLPFSGEKNQNTKKGKNEKNKNKMDEGTKSVKKKKGPK
jgi:hypothetical protein